MSPHPPWHPSLATSALVAALVTATVGVPLPMSPLAPVLGFERLTPAFLLVLLAMVVAYLLLVDFAKRVFYAGPGEHPASGRRRGHADRVRRRAARFTTGEALAT